MLSPAGFVSAYAQIGAKKCTNSAARLFLAAVLAGFFIAAGAVAASTASCGLDNASVARVVSGLLFPFGLIMVILTGAELFTGNCLIAVSLLEGAASWTGMVRNLILVYLGNFVGAAALAGAMAYSGALSSGALAAYTLRQVRPPLRAGGGAGDPVQHPGVCRSDVLPLRSDGDRAGGRGLRAGVLLHHRRL